MICTVRLRWKLITRRSRIMNSCSIRSVLSSYTPLLF